MSIKLYFTGKLRVDRDSLIPSADSIDVEEEGNPRLSYTWQQFSWLGKTFNVEKQYRGSVPFLFLFLYNLFSYRRS